MALLDSILSSASDAAAAAPAASLNSGKLEKASIWNADTNKLVVECMFNPTEYSFTKTNSWKSPNVLGKNLPIAEFLGGGAWTLTLSLLFDTYSGLGKKGDLFSDGASGKSAYDGDEDKKPDDVRDYTEKVAKLMKIDPQRQDPQNKEGRPPKVIFRWGETWSFTAVITRITQRFTLFLADGTPVRATLDVDFQQVDEEGTYPKTNPTSYADVQAVHVVVPGETIDSIAFAEYGDSSFWRLIADSNGLDDPLRLRPGQKLAIPPAGSRR